MLHFPFIIVNPVLCYSVTATVKKTDLAIGYLVTSYCKMKRSRFDNMPNKDFLRNTVIVCANGVNEINCISNIIGVICSSC